MNGTRNIKVPSGLFFIVFIFLLGIGCENPGSVGKQIDDSDINVADTTIYIPSTSIDSVDAYSGLLEVFSAGIFDDPLFGRVEATSLLKPSLPAFDDVIGPNAVMKLRLKYNSEQVYGDSTSQADFEVIELDEIWRGKAWKYSDSPPLPDNSGSVGSSVASFTVSNQDSIEVTLGQNWVNKYKSIYNNSDTAERDSLYLYDLFGLAIVPQNNAQIIPFSNSNSEFVIEEADDTTVVSLRDWATSIKRTNQPNKPADTNLEFSTLEKMTSFRMDLTAEEFGTTVNISNVELIVPVDIETMKQSLDPLPSTTVRPGSTFGEIYFLNPQFLQESIGPGAPLSTGDYSTEDNAFHFDITSLVNSSVIGGVDANKRFYITLNLSDGVLRSSLFFNEDAPDEKRPRLIITYIKSEDL